MKFVVAGAEAFQGSGHLEWKKETGIRFKGFTNGAEKLRQAFGRPTGEIGQLVPDESFAHISGSVEDGSEFEAGRILLDGYSVNFTYANVPWDVPIPYLTLRRTAFESFKGCGILAVLDPVKLHFWPRRSEYEDRNPDFGESGWKLDWLTFDCSIGKVSARLAPGDRALIRVFQQRADNIDPRIVLNAICRAFAFLIGHRVGFLGYEMAQGAVETRHLENVRIKRTRRTFPEPIYRLTGPGSGTESLLGKAVDYFVSDEGIRFAKHLQHCWDTQDNADQTRLVVASICLEGMLKLVSKRTTAHSDGFTNEDKEKTAAWLKNSSNGLSPRFVDRLRGFLGTLHHRRPNDILNGWVSQGVLGVTKEDVGAWKDTRNPGAHAGLIAPARDRDDLQKRITNYRRIANLINKVTLQQIGYEGMFTDYGQPNWPLIPFPKASPESL